MGLVGFAVRASRMIDCLTLAASVFEDFLKTQYYTFNPLLNIALRLINHMRREREEHHLRRQQLRFHEFA